MHPKHKEVGQNLQEACEGEEGGAGQTLSVEARTGSLGGIQRDYLSSQGSVRKPEALVELNLARDIKGNRKASTGKFVIKGRTGEM